MKRKTWLDITLIIAILIAILVFIGIFINKYFFKKSNTANNVEIVEEYKNEIVEYDDVTEEPSVSNYIYDITPVKDWSVPYVYFSQVGAELDDFLQKNGYYGIRFDIDIYKSNVKGTLYTLICNQYDGELVVQIVYDIRYGTYQVVFL